MEGIPVSIMEAMACQLPVIASQLSGIPELVRPNETGYLVPPTDATALATALADMYNNYEKAVALAENGRKLVLEQFELRANVQQLSQLFQNSI